MKTRYILAITGTRSDYGPMRPVFRAIENDAMLKLGLIVTGMHLLLKFGSSIQDIERDGFPVARTVRMLANDDSNAAMAKGVATAIYGFSDAFDELKPDVILLQGDRGEMLAAAIAAAHMNIPVVHMSGGDFSGSIDDSIRHAITKFAHVHLVTCERSANSVRMLGEDEARIFIAGEPSLDVIRTFTPWDRDRLAEQFRLDPNKQIILATQHPVTSESEQAGAQMRETMEALAQTGVQTILTYPNSDAGNEEIIRVMEDYRDNPLFRFSRNMPHDGYLSLLGIASVMVGNSSSGIIEAPSFKLPVVNVGTRQINRTRAANVIDVGYDREEIAAAIHKSLNDPDFRRVVNSSTNPYGDGHTSEKTVAILKSLNLGAELTSKWLHSQNILSTH